ncbi:MAG TPA: DNA-processing protein DprA [Steroidobacteraceae bacterium]|nr:DNA-processing protein DprA [Steroidobacteraceae bacterium]
MDDPKPWLTLARAPGLHAGHLRDPEGASIPPLALLREPARSLGSLGLGAAMVEAIRNPSTAGLEADERWLAGSGRTLVTWGSPEYPALLATIPDAPLVLFVAGAAASLHLPQLAVVGSRNPTAIGRDTAEDFARHLAAAGFAITSGLALGIDAAAHRGALAGRGLTIAVLGCGLDRVYPRENAALAEQILAHGALVTDFPAGTPPLKQHFPRRNRIISGLAVGTLVVEAALQSGSLITARLAAEQGREVFAIPGSIHSPLSRGCHRLIRQGAKLVETADDIYAELGALVAGLGSLPAAEATEPQQDSGLSLDKDYEILLDALGFEPAGVDTLVARTGLEAGAVASMLLILELEGRIAPQPGGLYCRRQPGKKA